MVERKRLDVYVKSELRDFISEESERSGRPMNAIVEEILTQALAKSRGELIEQQSLPVIRELLFSALRKHKVELRQELREDLRMEVVDVVKEGLRRSTDRLAALLVRSVRDSAMIRRLMYTLLAKSVSVEFAQKAYKDAQEKAGQELSSSKRNENDTRRSQAE
ncbi:hypothetical protein EPA93_43315 [Ktedonosporobacter rubrisoli]|uniref:Uncharacterized protein n=1 Tax=Ktedonosporobacter rubrisoli TaxID=2509675 RepID=A0A4P6K4I8_KTERU|nr:hypothetical protein [Ktedonosporobacter rubrisoli]QBD82446.1 hypothetical protein EPA93_43315 [Ktedonosporobacter rubrisoli]